MRFGGQLTFWRSSNRRLFLPLKQLLLRQVNGIIGSKPPPVNLCRGSDRVQREVQSLGTFPPPGWCFRLSVEPILDLTCFRSGIGAAAARGGVRLFIDPGDLGVERTTATFFTLLASAAAFAESAWLEGDFGVPGLLCPLWASSAVGEATGQRFETKQPS